MMANVTHQPRQTEYKGVVYRSKCEAMFARYLELHNEHLHTIAKSKITSAGMNVYTHGFLYEPDGFCVDGWTPDFVRFRVLATSVSLGGMPSLAYEVIEYKPSAPTDTYLQTWAQRCRKVFQTWVANGWHDMAYRVVFHLYWGSVYTDAAGVFGCCDTGEWKPVDASFDWLSRYADEIRSTRFDLKAEA